jgi:hypothetical protein
LLDEWLALPARNDERRCKGLAENHGRGSLRVASMQGLAHPRMSESVGTRSRVPTSASLLALVNTLERVFI